MNFNDVEKWIRNDLIFNNNLSLNRLSKGVKLFEVRLDDGVESKKAELNKYLIKILQKISKKEKLEINWFKINIIDNAVTQLFGIGKLNRIVDASLLIDLLMKDTADQRGDTIVGIFNDNRNWVLKLTNDQDDNRIYIKIFGDERIIGRVEG